MPFNIPPIDETDLKYQTTAIERGRVAGNGDYTGWSESILETRLKTCRVLLTSSCTHALELSAVLGGIRHGDEVIVPSFTFVSTANAFALHGARIVFADVEPDTLNVSVETIQSVLTNRTRIVVVVHYGGVAVDMDPIIDLCNRQGIQLIEDNAHGLFGFYKDRPLGSMGRLAALSFHETKGISCGEGGAIVINDKEIISRAEILRDKGTDRKDFLLGRTDRYTWVDIGSSWILSELLASVLYSQLERSTEILGARQAVYEFYDQELSRWRSSNGVVGPTIPSFAKPSFHTYYLIFQTQTQRDDFIEYSEQRGVNAVFHYQSLNESRMGELFGSSRGSCPIAEQASRCLVRLPLFSKMSKQQRDQVVEVVSSFET